MSNVRFVKGYLKNNQVPFFNGYRPQFYFKPKLKEKQNDN